MKRRNPGSTTTTRQVNIPQQQIPQQPPQQQYGYPPRGPAQIYPPGVGPSVAGYAQQQPQQQQRPITQQRQGVATQFEQNDGIPQINHYGKIQMKDAITLITLRLAKLEELTGSPAFNSMLETGGNVSNDSVSDANVEMIDNISERLNHIELNISVLMQEINTLKYSIDTIITQTSVDEEQQRLLVPEWNNPVNVVSDLIDTDNQVIVDDASTDGENDDDN